MTTFWHVKLMAQSLEYDYLRLGRNVANNRKNFYYFYAYDAAISYFNMARSHNKLFWWKLVVIAIRMSNYYDRDGNKQKLYIMEV